jgi:hypothetical protein
VKPAAASAAGLKRLRPGAGGVPTAGNTSRLGRTAAPRSVVKCSRWAIALDDILQTGLVNRNLAALEPLELLAIDVDAGDLIAAVGEESPADQSDIARADNCDIHNVTSFRDRRCGDSSTTWLGQVTTAAPFMRSVSQFLLRL